MTATLDEQFNFAGVDLSGVDSIDLGNFALDAVGGQAPVHGYNLSVAHADLVKAGSGNYSVLDTAGAIEAAVTDSSAGSLGDASSVSTTDSTDDGIALGDTLTLTVAEYGQLVDGQEILGKRPGPSY